MLFPHQTPSKLYAAVLLAVSFGVYYLSLQHLPLTLLLSSALLLANHLINTHYQFQNTSRFQNAISQTFTNPENDTLNPNIATFFTNLARENQNPLHQNLVSKEPITTYKKTMAIATLQCLIGEAVMFSLFYYGFQYLTEYHTLQSFLLILIAIRPAHVCLNKVPTTHTRFTEQINQVFFDAIGQRFAGLTPNITQTLCESIDILIARSKIQTNPTDKLYAQTLINHFNQFQNNHPIDHNTSTEINDNPTLQQMRETTLQQLQPRIQQLQQLYPH